MLGPRFIPESVFYTQSVMLSPRFIPESVFYTQSVVHSPQSMYTDRLTNSPGTEQSKKWRRIEQDLLTLACVASVSVQFGSKELQGDEWSE